jgi:hypothetical protein
MNTGGNMYPGNSMDSLVNPLIAKNTVYMSKSEASFVQFPLEGYTSSVTTVDDMNMLQIYPNPADNELFISLGRQVQVINYVMIYSISGELLIRQEIGKTNESIDISLLPKGLYNILAYGDDWVYNTRFVKN